MGTRVTITSFALICLAVGLVSTAFAQPVRNNDDIIWARDVAGAELTLDGELSEDVWQQAETIPLIWDDDFRPEPGSGQRVDGSFTPASPPDPNNGIVYILRDGNTLWLGAEVQDKSIGGQEGFFNFDGLIMNILDRTRHIEGRVDDTGAMTPNFFPGNRTEFFIVWRNVVDTTDADDTYANGEVIGSGMPAPGTDVRLHGHYGMDGAQSVEAPRDPAMQAIWDAVAIVDGISNDDTHGDDVGYTIEMRLDMTPLGYDFTQAGGDKAAWNIALQDFDYTWPADLDNQFKSRVWWQNQWGNNFNEGAAYIMGAPGVTVAGEAPDVTVPEFTVPSGELYDAPEIDGSLDEPAWNALEPVFFVQYQADRELLDQNPEIARYQQFYYRPDIGGQTTAIVVDPSVAEFEFFFRDNWLYVGVDVDDQAISGTSAENGMDGIYLFLRDRDSTQSSGSLWSRRFDVSVDSSGNARLGQDALAFSQDNPDAFQAAVSLKGSSTPADASDVDEGYQIEMAINLEEVLAYPADRGDGRLWVAMNFLDGDFLQAENDSYAMRTWVVTERAGGGVGASIYGYMDPSVQLGVSTEPVSELPRVIELKGNYPNPFNPSTTLRYALPQSGQVTVHIYDALGRNVMNLEPGIQTAGRHELRFDARGMASGAYFYRVSLVDLTESETLSTIGRMILVK